MGAIAKIIKKSREKMNLTQKELSEKTGIHYQQISQIETGRVSVNINNARWLSKALHIKPKALIKAATKDFKTRFIKQFHKGA